MSFVLARRGLRFRPCRQGQAMVEAAITFPLLLMTAIGLVQFAIFVHALIVVTGAVQDGARVAASEDQSLTDGVGHTRALLEAGLGQSVGDLAVSGREGSDAVVIEAQGRLRLIIPWAADAALPVGARSVVSKERFRAGPNR